MCCLHIQGPTAIAAQKLSVASGGAGLCLCVSCDASGEGQWGSHCMVLTFARSGDPERSCQIVFHSVGFEVTKSVFVLVLVGVSLASLPPDCSISCFCDISA